MRYLEIVPKGGSHYLVLDGQEICRHDDVRVAEAVRLELLTQFVSDSALADAEPPPENQNARLDPCQVQRALQQNELQE